MGHSILVVTAPGVSSDQLQDIEDQLELSLLEDASQPTIVDTQLSFQIVDVEPSTFLVMSAPGAEPDCIDKLRKKLLEPSTRLIVVPFEVSVAQLPTDIVYAWDDAEDDDDDTNDVVN